MGTGSSYFLWPLIQNVTTEIVSWYILSPCCYGDLIVFSKKTTLFLTRRKDCWCRPVGVALNTRIKIFVGFPDFFWNIWHFIEPWLFYWCPRYIYWPLSFSVDLSLFHRSLGLFLSILLIVFLFLVILLIPDFSIDSWLFVDPQFSLIPWFYWSQSLSQWFWSYFSIVPSTFPSISNRFSIDRDLFSIRGNRPLIPVTTIIEQLLVVSGLGPQPASRNLPLCLSDSSCPPSQSDNWLQYLTITVVQNPVRFISAKLQNRQTST